MESSTSSLLDDDEKLVLTISLSVLGLIALGGFILVLIDPVLFRDDEDDEDEFYENPSWALQQVREAQEKLAQEVQPPPTQAQKAAYQQHQQQQQYAYSQQTQQQNQQQQALVPPPKPKLRTQATQTSPPPPPPPRSALPPPPASSRSPPPPPPKPVQGAVLAKALPPPPPPVPQQPAPRAQAESLVQLSVQTPNQLSVQTPDKVPMPPADTRSRGGSTRSSSWRAGLSDDISSASGSSRSSKRNPTSLVVVSDGANSASAKSSQQSSSRHQKQQLADLYCMICHLPRTKCKSKYHQQREQQQREQQLAVYQESQDTVESVPPDEYDENDSFLTSTTESSRNNKQLSNNNALTIYEAPEPDSRGESKAEKEPSRRRDSDSVVEIASYTPMESGFFSLPEEVKNFTGSDPLSPVTPSAQPNLASGVVLPQSLDKLPNPPPPPPPPPMNQLIKVTPMKSVTLIPRYSYKAERQRFIVLNALILVITGSIVSVVAIQLYL